MLEFNEAVQKISEQTPLLGIEGCPLSDCFDRVLAKDLKARISLPSFDNSAVDGFALGKESLNHKYKIQGEVSAGDFFKSTIKPGHAVQIFTGAPVPMGTTAIVMQEFTARENGSVIIQKKPKAQANIRFRGEDIEHGSLLLAKDTQLKEAQMALLASVGYTEAPVYALPKVALLPTGTELTQPGKRLLPGKIFDSNTTLLESMIRESGALPERLPSAKDVPGQIRQRVREGLKRDVLIIAGGVSVGKYDYVKDILKKEGVEEIFWKVNIKPGKPLYFGKRKKTLVFGLPGNPVSVFVTFLEFVKGSLLKMQAREESPQFIAGQLTDNYENGNRKHFLRVIISQEKGKARVTPLMGQGSHMLRSLAQANAILVVEANAKLKKNQKVTVKRI